MITTNAKPTNYSLGLKVSGLTEDSRTTDSGLLTMEQDMSMKVCQVVGSVPGSCRDDLTMASKILVNFEVCYINGEVDIH